MERPNKLADLKLVSKHYPAFAIANYSYPRSTSDSLSQRERLVGRSSVGSESSVPDMVDDRDSIISTDEDDKSFYHVSGAEIWDKFWEDSWDAHAEEAEPEAERHGITQRIPNRNASYPALIPSPDQSRPGEQYFRERAHPPLPPVLPRPVDVAASTTPQRPVTPKVSYSLFPRQTPPPPAIFNTSPPRPDLTPHSHSLWASPAFNASTASLTSLGRSLRVRKARSELPISKGRSSWIVSAAAIPVVAIPSPPAIEIPTRRDSSPSASSRQQYPIRSARAVSHTLVSPPPVPPAPRPPNPVQVTVTYKDFPLPPLPVTPRLPRRLGGRHSHPGPARKIPPPLQLHRCTADTGLPPPPPPPPLLPPSSSSSSQRPRPTTSTSVLARTRTSPCTPTMPTHHPPLVSFFDVDTDSDTDSDTEAADAGFARRLARSLFAVSSASVSSPPPSSSQVRARSVGAAPWRSRKGHEVARQQLRRARAETVGVPAEDGVGAAPAGAGGGSRGDDHKAGEDPRPPLLRRQRSEVFGRIFGSRRA